MRGRFISIEGIDGAGKSTLASFIEGYLTGRGLNVVLTREPGGTGLAEEIRRLLLLSGDEKFEPMTELLLMFSSRAQHIAQVIQPAIEDGTWVLCERFTEATLAYQGGGRGVSPDSIEALAKIVHGGFNPDLSIYLDVTIDEARRRMVSRSKDRFEEELDDFFGRVRKAYLDLVAKREYMVLIDSSLGVDRVNQEVTSLLESWL